MTNDKKPALLILAAGLGARYGSLKQIDKIGPNGERIIDYSVFDALRSGFGKIVYVIRENIEEEFKEVIIDTLPKSIDTECVFQELDSFETDIAISPLRVKPWGTGHALLSASSAIDGSFAVINADDFYGVNSFKLAYEFLNSNNKEHSEHALIGYKLFNTLSEYGSVSRGICEVNKDSYMQSVIERTKIKKVNDKIKFFDDDNTWKTLSGSEIVSMNMFAFMPTIFDQYKYSFNKFIRNYSHDLNAEFYLPSVVDEVLKNKNGKVKVLETPDQWFGLTYKEDKEIVVNRIMDLINNGIYPEKLW